VHASVIDSAGKLKPNHGIYIGSLDPKTNIANTSAYWNGTHWAMVMLPLPGNKQERIDLLAHELFHRAQPSLGFNLLTTDNNHLEEKNGRIYLRLELQALKKALQSKDEKEMKFHLTNAFAFRKKRYQLFPGADSLENQLELNEGLAEYTGLMMSVNSNQEAVTHLANTIDHFFTNATYGRSFAYQTIPAYGYLLSRSKKFWNKEITTKTNLASYFIKSLKLAGIDKKITDATANSYGGVNIINEENKREEEINKTIAAYKEKFIQQPHLEIRFEQMNISYDPRNVMPIGANGTVYPNLRITDKWGILTATNGALVSSGWDKVTLSAPTKIDSNLVSGDGWNLQPDSNYNVLKDSTGNYKLLKK